MSPAALLITFFLFILGAISAAGYVFVLRPSVLAWQRRKELNRELRFVIRGFSNRS